MTFEIDRDKLYRFLRYRWLAFLIPRFGRWWPAEYLKTLEYRRTPARSTSLTECSFAAGRRFPPSGSPTWFSTRGQS
jgi:hypothetical protein